MEDRKRPGGPDESAPPAKRQAVTVNGAKPHQDADLPFKDDIESYQKDAILRQMREFKREKLTLEAQLLDVEKRAKYHDEHLRTIDAWFDQLIDDVKILNNENVMAPPQDALSRGVPASLLQADNENLTKHLAGRREKIISTLKELFSKQPTGNADVAALQQQISGLLAKEKEHIIELQRVMTEKEQMSDRLDVATHRYMIAEKKIDRLKSAQVQKLEKQAIANVVKEETPTTSNGVEPINGIVNGVVSEELETAKSEAIAEATKRKEQLEQLEAENKKLTEQLTALNIKLAGLSDDDYAKTDLFKALKSQHEDVIKRINNLEATNIQLREEAQKYQAERTAYRMKVDEEARASLTETESNLVTAEANLARIRHSRDELLAKVSILEAGEKDVSTSRKESQGLVNACNGRIAALESECQRLKLQLDEQSTAEGEQSAELAELTPEQLRGRVTTLQKQYKMLSDELTQMEEAYKSTKAVATKKVAEIVAIEDLASRASADKVKAEQKYFSTMKLKDTLDTQVRVWRLQASKSTEVVAQLKESDAQSRSLIDKLEKQLAEMRAQMEELSVQHRALQQKCSENAITSQDKIVQIAELKKLLETKDSDTLAAKHAQREAESKKESMAAQVKGLEKQIDQWKKKSSSNQSEDAAMMQALIQCQVCKNNFKDTVIKTCGHLFCNTCIQDRLINRARKCPNCGKAFGNNDTMRVHW